MATARATGSRRSTMPAQSWPVPGQASAIAPSAKMCSPLDRSPPAANSMNDHALQALKDAGQSNPGSDANYCDKIERALRRGKENPRSAPPRRRTPKRAAKQRSNAAETSKSDIGNSVGDGSCPSCPSYPRVLNQPTGGKKICVNLRRLGRKDRRS